MIDPICTICIFTNLIDLIYTILSISVAALTAVVIDCIW